MASSRKRSPDPVEAVRAALVRHTAPAVRLTLGLSGGLDSVVLLDILWGLSTSLGFRLSALHVHHGLSPRADAWARFCAELCRVRGIKLTVAPVTVDRASGQGLEAAARAARYRVFAQADADWVVLAHHRDDQAETLLLQLLRGAGPAGLAAMPVASAPKPGSETRLLRPLLAVPRRVLEDYARARGLAWVEDESNADLKRDRNFLRHRVLPLLRERFPAAGETLARAAGLQGEAAALLETLARMDGEGAVEGVRLRLERLRALPPERVRNLLRWFLIEGGVQPPPGTRRLEEALRQLLQARRDAEVAIPLGGRVLRRYLDSAWLVAPAELPENARIGIEWRGEAKLALPWGGTIEFEPTTGAGIDAARLKQGPVAVRLRRGGERFQPDGGRPRRTLKNLLQEARVPPWEREALPLLTCGGEVVWVPGLGVDWGYRCPPGQPGLIPHWVGAERPHALQARDTGKKPC
ncbi:MAG: tRNA(Ile)-lysidine synthase [Burkholderiales bacterium]|nr:MAG: tRNA(Ile)-lysidine synthase [Burkholderiales bacterium]